MQLNYWKASWPLQSDVCPCDIHFIEYLQARGVSNKLIFHFGTGKHHILGKTNCKSGVPNEILGITASREEYDKYIEFVIDNPVAAKTYKVIFADIYTLTPRIIPYFDLVTLFHLCEYYDEEKSSYADLNDYSLLELFLLKLNPGGRIFFYKGSSHFFKCREIIESFVGKGKLVQIEEYKTLLAYGCPGEEAAVS